MSKSSKSRLAGLGVLFAFLFLLHAPPALAQAHVALPLNEQGALGRAPYNIRVPANWNGTLLVFAHGYRDKADHPGEIDNRNADAAPGGALAEEFFLAQGFALAGSAFKDNGWAVKEGIQNILALTNFFKGRVGKPDRIILWGVSMGSVVTLESNEKFPGIYDGTIALCTIGAGAPRSWDGAVALSLAYDLTFGWPSAWGSVGDVRDDLDFETEVFPIMFGQFTNPANFGQLEFMRLVNGIPSEDLASWPFTDLFFATEARAEVERRAGGPVGQNLDHFYSLTVPEKTYLASLGVDADALLAAMNARTNIFAASNARNYIEHYAELTGNLRRPVLSLHTEIDGLVPVSHESAYRETVEAAGKSHLLVQAFTNGVGHCAFTGSQLFSAVVAMQFWLDTGTPPGPGFFPAVLGFIPGFVPPPFPYQP